VPKEVAQKTPCRSENVKEPGIGQGFVALIKTNSLKQKMKLSQIILVGLIVLASIFGAVYLGKSALSSSGLVQIQAPYGVSVTVDGRPPSAR
jgi:uncharacterized membrane protein